MNLKIDFLGQNFAHFGRFEGSFLIFLGSKKSISRLFQVVIDLFRKCLGFVFGLKGLIFECILSSKGR